MSISADKHKEKAELEIASQSEADTEALGQAIGLAGRGGEVVGLVGELGAGKTRLVKGIATGLGIKEQGAVRSPTFVLIREHAGRLRLFHVDGYRLSGAAELACLGFEELLEQGGFTVVEWADHVKQVLPSDQLELHLRITGANSRRISFRAGGPESEELLERIKTELARMARGR